MESFLVTLLLYSFLAFCVPGGQLQRIALSGEMTLPLNDLVIAVTVATNHELDKDLDDILNWDLYNETTVDISGRELSDATLKKILNEGGSTFRNHLQYLDISSNQIKTLSHELYGELVSLKSLRVQGNQIGRVSSGALQNNTALEFLDLSNLGLFCIDEDAFIALTELRELNVSRNKLTTFSALQSAQFKRLQVLDLSHNLLSSLPRNLRHFMNAVSASGVVAKTNATSSPSLSMDHNKWYCDCHMKWLLLHKPIYAKQVVCHQPVFLANQSLSQIDVKNLTCQLPTPVAKLEGSPSYMLRREMYDKAVFPCMIDGAQPDAFTWTTPSNEIITRDSHCAKDAMWVDDSGSLVIRYFAPKYIGDYKCQVNVSIPLEAKLNTSSRANSQVEVESKATVISLDVMIRSTDMKPLRTLMIKSLVMGTIIALIFSFFSILIKLICKCIYQIYRPKREAIQHLLQSFGAYKANKREQFSVFMASLDERKTHRREQLTHFKQFLTDHLIRMRGNYHGQIGRIRENCANRMERLRDNYGQQLGRMRDYSSGKADKLRDNYSSQMIRIREYSNTKLETLQETYKIQQQYLLKVLETLNIQNCRGNSCTRPRGGAGDGSEFYLSASDYSDDNVTLNSWSLNLTATPPPTCVNLAAAAAASEISEDNNEENNGTGAAGETNDNIVIFMGGSDDQSLYGTPDAAIDDDTSSNDSGLNSRPGAGGVKRSHLSKKPVITTVKSAPTSPVSVSHSTSGGPHLMSNILPLAVMLPKVGDSPQPTMSGGQQQHRQTLSARVTPLRSARTPAAAGRLAFSTPSSSANDPNAFPSHPVSSEVITVFPPPRSGLDSTEVTDVDVAAPMAEQDTFSTGSSVYEDALETV